jgi:DNA invertase Pin-like site-specific DNA recombinase
LIRERVSAGMKAAKAHGTKTGNAMGRPRRIFNRDEVARLRESGLSIEKIADQMDIGVGTVVRVLQNRPA